MTTPPSQLTGWPPSCGDPSCKAHLGERESVRCRCPRYAARGPGYHITKPNPGCPVHGAVDVEIAPDVAGPRQFVTIAVEAMPEAPPGYTEAEVNAARLGHAPGCEFRVKGRPAPCTCPPSVPLRPEYGDPAADELDSYISPMAPDLGHERLVMDADGKVNGGPPGSHRRARAAAGRPDLEDVCHREIKGTDGILSPCPQCKHLIAVHVGTDGCPVCRVEMLAAWARAAR